MRNSVNLLIVLYLALAPGMDVSQLLKSVQLCEYFESQMASDPCQHGQVEVAHTHSHRHDGHSHGEPSNDTPDDEGSDHHHHDENIVVETGVMAGAVSVFSITPIAVYGACRVLVQEQSVVASIVQHSPRAPPWMQYTLTVKLLV